MRKIKGVIGSLTNRTILDFGCGPGFLLDATVEIGIKPLKYIALDFSRDSIQCVFNKTIRKFEVESFFVQTLPSNIEANTVDICFLIEVIEHLNDEYLVATLQEIYRVLKPQGKLVLTTPNNEDLRLGLNFCPECGCIYHRMQHVRSWTISSLSSTLANFNLKAIYTKETTFLSSKLTFYNIHRLIQNLLRKKHPNLFLIFEK